MSHHFESPFSFRPDATAMIVGVGLMGQFMARRIGAWLGVKRLILVDHASSILVDGRPCPLQDFAKSLQVDSRGAIEVLADSIDVADEGAVKQLFKRHRSVHYWMHTAGISPRPLTPPEQMTKSDVLGACEINMWGAMNVLNQGALSGAFSRPCRGVILLSTSATVGSEGRASAAYEVSKAGLANFLMLHSRYFVERYGIVLNGLAPSPLKGIMAAQNPLSAQRLQAVQDATPLGGLTTPEHIAAATLYFWAEECWCVGEILTIDGGYTKHRPVFRPD